MNTQELIQKVDQSMERQCRERGFASPVDVLIEIGMLSRENHDEWRKGRIPFLERACAGNLSKLDSVLREMSIYGRKHGLKPSFSFYKQGGGKGKQLRFSKSGSPALEKRYATHFVAPREPADG